MTSSYVVLYADGLSAALQSVNQNNSQFLQETPSRNISQYNQYQTESSYWPGTERQQRNGHGFQSLQSEQRDEGFTGKQYTEPSKGNRAWSEPVSAAKFASNSSQPVHSTESLSGINTHHIDKDDETASTRQIRPYSVGSNTHTEVSYQSKNVTLDSQQPDDNLPGFRLVAQTVTPPSTQHGAASYIDIHPPSVPADQSPVTPHLPAAGTGFLLDTLARAPLQPGEKWRAAEHLGGSGADVSSTEWKENNGEDRFTPLQLELTPDTFNNGKSSLF